MDPATDTDAPHSAGKQYPGEDSGTALPRNWREALLTLVASRISLIQLESREASSMVARRAALGIAALICVFFTWTLLLAGLIGVLSQSAGWPWYWLAIAFSALHLLAGLICGRLLTSAAQPTFSITRSEFQKDREWLENFQKPRKSND